VSGVDQATVASLRNPLASGKPVNSSPSRPSSTTGATIGTRAAGNGEPRGNLGYRDAGWTSKTADMLLRRAQLHKHSVEALQVPSIIESVEPTLDNSRGMTMSCSQAATTRMLPSPPNAGRSASALAATACAWAHRCGNGPPNLAPASSRAQKMEQRLVGHQEAAPHASARASSSADSSCHLSGERDTVAVDDRSLKISQYTYFALKSETMAASATTDYIGVQSDSVLVRGAKRSVPALPVRHD